MLTNGTRSTIRTPRPGMSMAEVLVALFVMALGTIAILTLFPLGMFQMGQALKDDRTAQSASAADAYLSWYWRRHVIDGIGPVEPMTQAMSNPSSGPGGPPPGGATAFPSISTGPSYPVFVDPIGFEAPWQGGPTFQPWIGNFSPGRRSLNEITAVTAANKAYAQRVCSLMDGFGYDANGSGLPATGTGVVERELRYNWLWVLQQPDVGNPKTADMTVVVFDKRAFLFAPTGTETVFAPTAVGNLTTLPFPAQVPPNTTSVSFGTNIGVQKGGWIADVSTTTIDSVANTAFVPPAMPPPPPPGQPPPRAGVRNAKFYRVVSVTDNGAGGVDVELQTPLDTQEKGDTTGFNAVTHRRFLVLAGVSEVFVRPALTVNSN